MGCSSSTLNKAGDGNRLRSEESESCFAQPKPHTPGKESSTLYGKVQKESPPPLEKLKISAASTANGVKSLREQPLADDTTDPPGPTEDTQPLEGPRESEPLQPHVKDDTPGAGEKNDTEAVTEAQSLKGNAETESVGRDTKYQLSRITGERDSPGAVEGTENPQTAREMKPLGTEEKVPPLEAAREPQPQEAMGKGEQTQLPKTVPKENESPEGLEGGQFVEMAGEQKLQETLGKDEQSQLLETISKESESPETLEGSQFVETAGERQLQETVIKDEQSQLLETIPKESESPETLEGSQFVETAGERQLQETVIKDEQSQLLETIPKENETPEVLEESQFVETAVNSDLLHKTPEGLGNMEQIQPEGIVGSMEHPVGILETGANMETVRKIHTNEEDQHIEGETGEKVETEMEDEKVSEGAGTKEEETGEAVDLSAAM
ncbi:glutamate-rich protein 5 [Leopardus geoffroyi]|uniref:glutamate-rich protein 5 n=1 Tax=Leopardus geoffroyi TaxID=46844 RepID=UPI001E25FF81|nr:glutamate-rich protein 5 [Leopardus geoffroyi]